MDIARSRWRCWRYRKYLGSDSDTYGSSRYADADQHANGNADQHTNGYTNGNTGRNRNAYKHADRNADGNAGRNCDADRDADGYADTSSRFVCGSEPWQKWNEMKS